MAEPARDQWAEWLLRGRYGGDPAQAQVMVAALAPIREKVLANTDLQPGATLLDVGCGDGLIAFGALPLIGPAGTVIFSDISQDLLDHCRGLAAESGALGRCRFLRAPAGDLSAVAPDSVDAVTTRSVLIYVAAKQAAFAEFHRVLKPGGRLSIFEPINRFGGPATRLGGLDLAPIQEIAGKILAVYDRLQPFDTDPMLDFDERDLLTLAEQAGFREIHLEYQAAIKPLVPQAPWDVAIRIPGNPRVPSLGEVLDTVLTPDEAARFIAYYRPFYENGQGIARSAVAYLWALKQ
jgi:ubiquinone/menaquinone biosynthesis C-methylase UbiE